MKENALKPAKIVGMLTGIFDPLGLPQKMPGINVVIGGRLLLTYILGFLQLPL